MEPNPEIHGLIQGEHVEIDKETMDDHLVSESGTWFAGEPKTLVVEGMEYDTSTIRYNHAAGDSRIVHIMEWSDEHKTHIFAGAVAIGTLLYAIKKVHSGRKQK